MFISNLNIKQQGKLLALAKSVISADGVVKKQEEKFLDVLKAQCLPDVVPSNSKLTDLADSFTSQQEKVSLVLELIGIAYADSVYHAKEMKIIENIAEVLEVSDNLPEMEQWVEKQMMLVHEADKLMGCK